MPQFNNIKTLIFDFGGVLIDLNRDRCIQSFKKLGIPDVEKYLNNFQHTGIFIELEKGLITADEFRNAIRMMCPNSILTNEQIDHAWCQYLIDIPTEKINLLIELKKRFRIIMLSNTNPIHFPFAIKEYFGKRGVAIEQCFDKFYLSNQMLCAKPDKEIFLQLIDGEKSNPAECLFLDDGKKNIETAKSLGFQTYLVAEHENLNFLLNGATWK